MPELEWGAPPPLADLKERLRARLPALGGSLRVIAQDLLAADARIDWVTVDASGRTVLVGVVEPGAELGAIALALAQRAWVEQRLGDWLQLAPGLGIDPAAGVGGVLLAPSFEATARAAARALGADAPRLWIYRCVRNGAGGDVLVEPADPSLPSPPASPPAPARSDEAALSSHFRTSLTDARLGLTPEEQREFEAS